MSNPTIKFENSPADSLADSFDAATPNATYSSLFPENDSVDILTPPYMADDSSVFDRDMSMDCSVSGTPDSEKKQVKKRKSWGQQLPEPKTNLPPRKRAKTEDEKEQRRVERVLRNRRAAQSSRERKRQEVEALEAQKREIERRNRDLELRLAHAEAQNIALQQQLAQVTGSPITAFKTSPRMVTSIEDTYRQPSPLTLSQELFPSEQEPKTLDPASLTPQTRSPELKPISDSSILLTSDMTQHPAAMLCDLQCQSEPRKPWVTSTAPSASLIILYLTIISTTVTGNFLMPLLLIMDSLRTRSPLSPTLSILNTIIWLTTTPIQLSTSPTSAMTSRNLRSQRSPRFSLRMDLLRRLLACSPLCARPLMDATMGVMRLLLSNGASHIRDCLDGDVTAGVDVSFWNNVRAEDLPTMEGLMTLLWTTKIIDRQIQRSSMNERNSAAQGIRRANDEIDLDSSPVLGWGDCDLVEASLGSGKSTGDWSLALEH